MVVSGTTEGSPLSKVVPGSPWWSCGNRSSVMKFFKYSSPPWSLQKLSLSTGRFLTSRVSLPFYIVTRTLHRNLQINHTKQSAFSFPNYKNIFLAIILYLQHTEKVSCFGFQRPKVPVPEKKKQRTQTELLRYPVINTGRGRNLAGSQSAQTCLPLK